VFYTVWRGKEGLGIGVNEKCLITDNGDYVGLKTGKKYLKGDHYHSFQIIGKIITVDEINSTGMYHFDGEWSDKGEENKKSFKEKYIGCIVTLERAHFFGDIQVYRCLELNNEYFSDKEIEIIEDNKIKVDSKLSMHENRLNAIK